MIGHLERMSARVMMALGLGRVTATDDGKPTQLLQVQLDGTGEVRDNTDSLSHYGFSSRPKPGADAVIAFVGGNRGAGLVIATADRRYRLTLAEGEVALHDDLGHKVHLTRAGIVVDGGGHALTIRNAPTVNVPDGDVVVKNVSFLSHVHKNTQPGSGLSGTPNGAP